MSASLVGSEMCIRDRSSAVHVPRNFWNQRQAIPLMSRQPQPLSVGFKHLQVASGFERNCRD
eukprot:11402794-Alexandrium_andersonii.AAC.1